MKRITVIIFLIFLILFNQSQARVKKTTKQRERHIFILMGQSNMSGYGELLPEDTIPVPDVFCLPTLYTGDLDWKPASHPLHNRLKSDRFGLGLPFAKEYMKNHPGVEVGLIPVGFGGAGINKLTKGTPVYDDAIAKAKFATKNDIIKGALWHQGETDTSNKELADSYEVKLHALIAALRADLEIPALPFIVGNLAEFYGTAAEHSAPERLIQINQVRKALQTLPSKVKNTGYVESTGCKSIDGHMVHFDRESYILLGGRYATEYEKMIKNNKQNEP